MSMRIGLVQMTSGVDPDANADAIIDALEAARADGADMLFSPEMALLLDRDRERSAPHVVAEADNAGVQRLRDAAARTGLWLALGSLPVSTADGNRRNRSLLITPDGSIAARYDKLHLFDVDLQSGERWRESNLYESGDAAVTADVGSMCLGLSVCYDLRFPALYQALSAAGANVLAVPAAFTVPTGKAHWHTLLRARAIENACYVVAAAQTGHHADGRDTFGHSLVVDPWGRVVLDMGSETGVGFATLDMAAVADARRQIPVIANRRTIPPVSRGAA